VTANNSNSSKINRPIALDYFLIPPDSDEFLKSLDQVDFGNFQEVGMSFRKNLSGILCTGGMPFIMANTAFTQRRFQQLHIAERILAKYVSGDPDDKAYESASKKLSEELSSAEGAEQAGDSILADLGHLCGSAPMKGAAVNLLYQCIVLTWSSFEVLATDLLVALLNKRPHLASVLMKDERTKRWFHTKDLPHLLEQFSYDVSHHMGDVLTSCHRIDDIDTIRATFGALLPADVGLRTALLEASLWKLNQKRNLIVHRGGIVDEAYISNTGENVLPGTALSLTPEELKFFLRLVRDTGTKLVTSVIATEKGPQPPAQRTDV
jgi:hypothetical protein